MKWFNNLKIGTKLITGFVIVALLTGFTGLMGYNGMNTMHAGEKDIAMDKLPSIQALLDASAAQTTIESAENALLAEELEKAGRTEQYNRINDALKRATNALNIFGAMSQTSEEKMLWVKFTAAWDKLKQADQDYLTLAKEYDTNKSDDLHKRMVQQALVIEAPLYADANTVLDQLVQINRDHAIATDKSVESAYSSSSKVVIITIILAILLALILGIVLAKVISKPIKTLTEIANKLAMGDVDVNVEATSKDEIGILMVAFSKMVENIKALMNETDKLIVATQEGKLDTRGNAKDFAGGWGTLVGGINNLIDTLVGHIDSIPSPVMIIDKDFNILYMNKNGTDLLSTTSKQIMGTKCYDSFKTSDCRTANCACAMAMQQGQKVSRETDAHPHGMNLDILYTGIPLKDEKNQVIGAMELIVDQTAIKNQTWLKTGQTELNEKIRGDQDLRALGNKIITYMAKYLNAQIGAIYLLNEDNILKMMGSYAYTRRKNLSNEIFVGEGLVGQSALEKQTIVITNVPDDYIKVNSGTFESAPRNIIVTPCIYNDEVKCVLELGSLQEITDLQQEFIEQIAESIAIAIHSTEARSKIQTLLDKTLEQSEKLQVQQEELRQSNEELEEQARSLKESEANLNAQQEELRVINEELEERTKSLELQKNDISTKNEHLKSAQKVIEDKAKDLEIASKYKSEFLANVSHELRTPLNSILVLSQLLANKTDHSPLTDKQLEFSKTIYSSGIDLLELINDVLDLSKIEAGKMDVNYETMSLEEFLDYVERSFRQIALDKGLELTINLDEQLPESISTDTQRVQQIINNLVSNALKFTKEGGVTINIGRPSRNDFPKLDIDYVKSISIAISDTGIGIPAEKQSLIFEAFRQSDGTTSREYGGTGLGLSISKELAKLLGGTIDLKSEEGKGSTFALILPEALVIPKEFEQVAATLQQTNSSIINLSDKMLLIIDDDQNFSSILADLAHEKGFTCLTSKDGETGIQLAIKHKPKAILLDLGLPGISGWEVIEELKNNIETRDIPVHIISGHENKTNESEKGIVGYLRKPVSVKKINDMFQRLEGIEAKSLKKLLIIASDEFQKTIIAEVIGNKGIVVSTVDTGQEACNLLKTERFDCIIFDTKLRDMSGYELLAKLREEKDQVPIIIYTDKDFITDDEGPLQDYGESIIIKGSRSMERLVAEASLFLHGVDSKIADKKQKVTKKYQEKEASLKDKKILIVDDDMRNVFALTSALEGKNMIVVVGKNGREGIDKLHQNQDIDLILMDIMMPEMDGYFAMKEIRKEEKFRKTPIIALTAKAMKEDKNKCIEAGANDYLTKPIELDKLISLLRVWLYK